MQKESLPPNVSILVSKILQANPYHSRNLNKALTYVEAEEFNHLEDYLVFYLKEGVSLDYLARCYNTIMDNVVSEFIYFQQHKKYRHSTFAEVANSVYYNKDYMSLYMHGVFITLFFWPNHLKLYRFFRDTIPNNKTGSYLEIGPGHGYFFMTAMGQTHYDNFTGIDISETSIGQTQKLVESKQYKKDIQLYCADFLNIALAPASFDAIIMGEMLEHVENPAEYLKKVVSIAKDDAYIFISTCINAPLIDHIYLFNNERELHDLFAQCGLGIKEQCVLPYLDKTLDECVKEFLAINIGYVLEKK